MEQIKLQLRKILDYQMNNLRMQVMVWWECSRVSKADDMLNPSRIASRIWSRPLQY